MEERVGEGRVGERRKETAERTRKLEEGRYSSFLDE